MIVLYDGQCLFCESWVRLLIKYRIENGIKFAPLQFCDVAFSDKLLYSKVPSIVVIDHSKVILLNAQASLYVMKNSGNPISFLARLLSFSPDVVTSFCYRIIGRYRHFIFGKKKFCSLPNNLDAHHFLKTKEAFLNALNDHSCEMNTLNKIISTHYQ